MALCHLCFSYQALGWLEWQKRDLKREKEIIKNTVNHLGHSLCLFLAMTIHIQAFVLAPFIV